MLCQKWGELTALTDFSNVWCTSNFKTSCIIYTRSFLNFRYSGITEKMLRDVTTRLSDVQAHLQKILPPDAILIGQSICSDLKSLQVWSSPFQIRTFCFYLWSKTMMCVWCYSCTTRTSSTRQSSSTWVELVAWRLASKTSPLLSSGKNKPSYIVV